MGTYNRQDIVFTRGEGSWLIAEDGTRYLDFNCGIAVNALGHAHPVLVEALQNQASKLWHTSNLYRVAGQERLAEQLMALTFADKVFFTNSGAEACEGAIKTARRYHFVNGNPERWRTITFKGAFHGRTLATIAAGGNETYLEGFGEPADGFDVIELGDLDDVKDAITEQTGAVLIEPILGEGGVRVVPDDFMRGLRDLCDEHGILLILDEVQTGASRTGKLFAYQWSGIEPDIMAIAKGIGGGFPLGAFLATNEVAKGMVPGTHGTTYGGNQLAMAVGTAVLDIIAEPDFLDGVQQKALRLKQELAAIKDEFSDIVEEIRGQGLLIGLKLIPPMGDLVSACAAQGLLTVGAAENTMRLIPALNMPDEDLVEGVKRLTTALADLRQALADSKPES